MISAIKLCFSVAFRANFEDAVWTAPLLPTCQWTLHEAARRIDAEPPLIASAARPCSAGGITLGSALSIVSVVYQSLTGSPPDRPRPSAYALYVNHTSFFRPGGDFPTSLRLVGAFAPVSGQFDLSTSICTGRIPYNHDLVFPTMIGKFSNSAIITRPRVELLGRLLKLKDEL